jgi:hypothetical protein
MNSFEIAAACYAIVAICLLYGASLFIRRGEHARTAFGLVLTWVFVRATLINWGKGGHQTFNWLSGDQATVLNAVMLAASCVMFVAAEREKAT